MRSHRTRLGAELSLDWCFWSEMNHFAVNYESKIKMSEKSQQMSSLQSLSI